VRDKYSEVIEALAFKPRLATASSIETLVPNKCTPVDGELCLFVTHAAQSALKRHVLWHIEKLIDAGIRVVLIVNADLSAAGLPIEPALSARLQAAYLRENVGFDFAAWAQAWSLETSWHGCERLYLINDSIVGPVSDNAFGAMLARIRQSRADVIGLTEGALPVPHLQSFFLAFNRGALHAETVQRWLASMHALPTKGLVVDVYETRSSNHFTASGLKVEAIFPRLSMDPLAGNDTLLRWSELVDAGFPYVKASLLPSLKSSARLQAVLPAALRS